MTDEGTPRGLSGRLRGLFNGHSTISRRISASDILSPKSPAPRLGLSILSSPRIDLAGLPSHTSPSARVSPRSATSWAPSPTGPNVLIPPPVRSRQSHPSISSPHARPTRPNRGSPRTQWEWEETRDSTGNTRRIRRRIAGIVQPKRAAKSIFREKAGRMKLIRCLVLGSLLAVGLIICRHPASFANPRTDVLQISRWRYPESCKVFRYTSS
jgi:hypothetical protein